jgi:colicin import membrane protein
MSERGENSVLFSLRELRNIEDDRVKSEADAEQARIEAERRAREEEIRRQREAEEAKVRAEEERVRREQQERERLRLEGELRLQESERRAQIEAATRIEQARIEAEARAKMEARKYPTGAIIGGVISLILIAGGVMTYLVRAHNLELAQQQARAESERKALLAAQEAEKKRFETTMTALQSQLDKATSDAERSRIRKQMEDASQARAAHHTTVKRDESSRGAKTKVDSRTNDPLGGLGL